MEEIKIDPNYDFNGPIEKTSAALAKAILKRMIDGLDYLIVENNRNEDPAVLAANIEKATDFGINVFKDISSSDLPYDYATFPIEKILNALENLKKYIGGSVSQTENELVSRTLATRSPKTGLYRKEVASVGQLLLALNKVQAEQGSNPDDYFDNPKVAPAPVADVPVESVPVVAEILNKDPNQETV